MGWSIDNIPDPPLKFQLKVFRELDEARARIFQIWEEAGMAVAGYTGYCRNHPDRACPSRGAYAGLCAECRAEEVERRRNDQNGSKSSSDVSIEKALKELIPKAREIDKKTFELTTKKGIVDSMEREVFEIRENFIIALRDLVAELG